MRLIDNQRVVLHQQSILLNFRQQYPVGHQFDLGRVADMIAKADFIAYSAAGFGVQLLGDAISHGARRQTARLGVAD